MGKFWAIFFVATAILSIAICVVAPQYGWWFPGDGVARSTLGQRIDHLFYLILIITTITFVGTQVALGYILWKGATKPADSPALFSHGSHLLEVVWTVIPAIVLLFIALYQMDVWAQYRIKTYFPRPMEPVAEVTARQFEWRIRYPAVGKTLQPTPQPDDLFLVNDLRFPVGRPIAISLRSDDVQHSLFIPELRVKQDAVPGKVIPVWWDCTEAGTYTLNCTELCGWGHYKMKAQAVGMSDADFIEWKTNAAKAQSYDGLGAGEENATASATN